MKHKKQEQSEEIFSRCCPNHRMEKDNKLSGITRRDFLGCMGTVTLGVATLGGVSWSSISATESEITSNLARTALKVMPIFVYSTPQRRDRTSWRSWGGIQSEQDAGREVRHIQRELNQLQSKADFPVEFKPIARIRKKEDVSTIKDLAKTDVMLVYAAGGWMDIFDALGRVEKDIIFFCRHKSGPVYLWYEIVSPRYLRQHTDSLAVKGINDNDVVIDDQEEILWRLRALCGLKNTLNTRILAIGGPGAWAQPKGIVPKLVEEKWNFDLITISYDELSSLIKDARADKSAVSRSQMEAEAYLKEPRCSLETNRQFVDNAFLLEQTFQALMKKADCQAITINGCMGTIMPIAETSACLTLSLLNDKGFLAFCESDFVVIPSGVLLANISGKPVFLNDPTYPHGGIITLAHCTAPRKMDGKKLEPVRILTHFESDYGAAPKVEMQKGQIITNIIPDFASKRWVGIKGEIINAPFMDICRSQIDIRFACDSKLLAERMPGFHWMTGYGDYRREIGYALRRVNIGWEDLG